MKCTSSTTSIAGVARELEARNRIVTSASVSRRNRSSRRAVSGGRRQIEAEQDPEQRQPRHERRVEPRRPLAQPPLDLGGCPRSARARAPSSIGVAECEVRRRGLVLLAARLQDGDVGAPVDELLTSRDLPIPGSPLISTIQPFPARTSSSTARSAASSASRPISGVSASRSPRAADDRADDRGPERGSAFPFARNGSIGVVSNVVRDRSSTISVERICPARPRLITRAAVLIASPNTR